MLEYFIIIRVKDKIFVVWQLKMGKIDFLNRCFEKLEENISEHF